MRKRALAITGSAVAVLLLALAFNTGTFHILRGDLLSGAQIAMLLKARADTNSDGDLSAREIRATLSRIIRDVILQRPEGDINNDGSVTREDISATTTGFRALLVAVCGNGAVNAGEQCDDTNTLSGDGCSRLCRTEAAYDCSGEPSTCTLREPIVSIQMMDLPALAATPSDGSILPNEYLPLAKFTITTATGSNVAQIRLPFTVRSGNPPSGPTLTLFYFDALGIDFDPPSSGFSLHANNRVTLAIDNYTSKFGDGKTTTFIVGLVHQNLALGTEFEMDFADAPIALTSDMNDVTKAVVVIADHASPLFLQGHLKVDGQCPDAVCTVTLDTAAVTRWTISAVCGDGAITSPETCDDSNTTAGDGCSATCGTETGFTCIGTPSVCSENPSLTVTRSALLAGQEAPGILTPSIGLDILHLDLEAKKGAVDVTELQFTADDPVTPANGARSVERMKILYRVAGSSSSFATATGTIAACGTDTVPNGTFCAHLTPGTLRIAANQKYQLLVVPMIRSDDVGGVSGDHVRITLDGTQTTAAGQQSLRALSVATGTPLTLSNGDGQDTSEVFILAQAGDQANAAIASPTYQVAMSKLIVFNAGFLSDPNGTAVPYGYQKIAAFDLMPYMSPSPLNGQNTVRLREVFFTVISSNIQFGADSFRLVNAADMYHNLSCTPMNVDGSPISGSLLGTFLVHCNTETDLGFDSTLSGQGMESYILNGNIVMPKINPMQASDLQVALASYGDANAVQASATTSHLRWSDTDAVTNTQFYWIEQGAEDVRSTLYHTEGMMMP